MKMCRRVGTLSVLALLASCSGKDEPKEPAEDAAKEDAAEAPAAEPADSAGETPAAEPAPEPAAAPAAAAPAPAPATPAEPAGFDGPKVTKYVTSFALNVRGGPSKEFPVKRHVKRGDQVEVVVNGEWAKLGPGEYVSMNRLADAPSGAKKGGKAKKKKK